MIIIITVVFDPVISCLKWNYLRETMVLDCSIWLVMLDCVELVFALPYIHRYEFPQELFLVSF